MKSVRYGAGALGAIVGMAPLVALTGPAQAATNAPQAKTAAHPGVSAKKTVRAHRAAAAQGICSGLASSFGGATGQSLMRSITGTYTDAATESTSTCMGVVHVARYYLRHNCVTIYPQVLYSGSQGVTSYTGLKETYCGAAGTYHTFSFPIRTLFHGVGGQNVYLSLISNYGVVDYTFRTPAGGGGWSQGYTSPRG